MFKVNEGNTDRILRIIVGIALIVLGLATSQILLAVVGLVPLLTGLSGFCLIYRLLGISTCPVENK